MRGRGKQITDLDDDADVQICELLVYQIFAQVKGEVANPCHVSHGVVCRAEDSTWEEGIGERLLRWLVTAELRVICCGRCCVRAR